MEDGFQRIIFTFFFKPEVRNITDFTRGWYLWGKGNSKYLLWSKKLCSVKKTIKSTKLVICLHNLQIEKSKWPKEINLICLLKGRKKLIVLANYFYREGGWNLKRWIKIGFDFVVDSLSVCRFSVFGLDLLFLINFQSKMGVTDLDEGAFRNIDTSILSKNDFVELKNKFVDFFAWLGFDGKIANNLNFKFLLCRSKFSRQDNITFLWIC